MPKGIVKTRTIPYTTAMLREYPEYYKEMRDRLLYDFGDGKRQFRGNPDKVGTAYPDD